MPESRVDLRNPLVAALLAYLVPGAGHLYQRRYFKAGLYSVCILGTFFYGMQLGDWRIVPSRITETTSSNGKNRVVRTGLRHFGYALNGLPALPATVQTYRYLRQDSDPFDPYYGSLQEPLSSDLIGVIRRTNDEGGDVNLRIQGQIKLEPDKDSEFGNVSGTFQGVDNDGKPVSLVLAGTIEIGPEFHSKPRRSLICRIVEDADGERTTVGYLEASIPRGFFNWFQMPLEKTDLEQLHGELGKHFEVAEIFMWIAGLLNLLAIWDAFEGPAYGYGDEPEESSDGKAVTDEESTDGPKPEEVVVAASAAG